MEMYLTPFIVGAAPAAGPACYALIRAVTRDTEIYRIEMTNAAATLLDFSLVYLSVSLGTASATANAGRALNADLQAQRPPLARVDISFSVQPTIGSTGQIGNYISAAQIGTGYTVAWTYEKPLRIKFGEALAIVNNGSGVGSARSYWNMLHGE